MSHHDGPTLPGEGATDYERYLKVPALLSLQKGPGELVHHDELLFQVEHQAAELWFKLVKFELDGAIALIESGRTGEAAHLLRRAGLAIRVTQQQILMLETMAPMDFHVIRLALGRGSGAESPGFRTILTFAPQVWGPFEELLRKRNVTLTEVYLKHREHYDLFTLAEALTNFDQDFQLWRQTHLTVIKRIIGRDVRSLKGYSVHQLEEDIRMELFPKLWRVRAEITGITGTSQTL